MVQKLRNPSVNPATMQTPPDTQQARISLPDNLLLLDFAVWN
jgi:hypothetical protein